MPQEYNDRQIELGIFERIMKICDKEFPNEYYTLGLKLHEKGENDIAVITIRCGRRIDIDEEMGTRESDT
jgi:hypothetical protein